MTLDAGRRNPTTPFPAGVETPPGGNPSGLAREAALSPAPVSRVALRPRDIAILSGVARGLTCRAIAKEVRLSPQAVKNELSARIYPELGATCGANAVWLARRQIEEFGA